MKNKKQPQPTQKKSEDKVKTVKESIDLTNPNALPADCATHAKKC